MNALLLLLACGDDAKTVPTGDTAASDTAAPDTGANDTATPDTAPPAPLALCVNELMPSTGGAYRAADGTSPDWVELHNPGATDVDLSGWTIAAEDAVGPLTGTLPAGGFLLLEAVVPQDTAQEDTAAPPSANGRHIHRGKASSAPVITPPQ